MEDLLYQVYVGSLRRQLFFKFGATNARTQNYKDFRNNEIPQGKKET